MDVRSRRLIALLEMGYNVLHYETMQLLKRLVVLILTLEARAVLARYKPRIIAVTGSVGKTATKDGIYAALSGEIHIRKSVKSYNSDIGVPLTILGCENAWKNPLQWIVNIAWGIWLIIVRDDYPQWLVLELGADRPGDIRRIARWLRPDVAVITGMPEIPVHVEYFDSPEAVLQEKRSLAEYLRPGGKLIINGDDIQLRRVHNEFRGATVTYGMEAHNDYCASHEEVIYDENIPAGVRFRVNNSGSSIPVSVYGSLGIPRIYSALAALAAAEIVGVDKVSAAKGLVEWPAPPGRVRILKGIRGSVIIDDTYNSSPAAALAALDTLKSIKATRRIAVMGDMLELGRYAKEAHRQVGERAAACADVLITVGFRARTMGEAALDSGMRDDRIFEYEMDEAGRAGKELESRLKEGDVVLVKGSQRMRMERTVLEIMAEPEKAAELLVRMEPEWQMQ